MTLKVVFFIVSRFNLLDLTGALSVYDEANSIYKNAYSLQVVSPQGGLIESEMGLSVMTEPIPKGHFHIVLIIGGKGPRLAAANLEIVSLVDSLLNRSTYAASICTGAFLLAATGCLNGREATTHWQYAALLQRHFPAVKVNADSIFIEDGNYWTSAGITTGIDLSLALIEKDYDTNLSKKVARSLVVSHRRIGGQSQFSTMLSLEPETDRLRKAWTFALLNLKTNLSVERLAEEASLSPRHFIRLFRAETGYSPAKAIEKIRVEAAKVRIEAGNETLETVAMSVGFSNAEHLRRAFLRVLGCTPQTLKREIRLR